MFGKASPDNLAISYQSTYISFIFQIKYICQGSLSCFQYTLFQLSTEHFKREIFCLALILLTNVKNKHTCETKLATNDTWAKLKKYWYFYTAPLEIFIVKNIFLMVMQPHLGTTYGFNNWLFTSIIIYPFFYSFSTAIIYQKTCCSLNYNSRTWLLYTPMTKVLKPFYKLA